METFVVDGVAPDVRYARAAAWEGLRAILGGEDEEQWGFKTGQYTLAEVPAHDSPEEPTVDDPPRFTPACRYHIELVRVEQEVAP